MCFVRLFCSVVVVFNVVILLFRCLGTFLLSGSVDNTAIVWDVESGTMKQQFEFHTGEWVSA